MKRKKSGRRTALAAVAVSAVAALTVAGIGVASAADDPPDPAFVDLAVSIGGVNLNDDWYGTTTMFLSTPHMLAPNGDVTVHFGAALADTIKMNGRTCLNLLGPFQCVIHRDELPSGWQVRQFDIEVQAHDPGNIRPRFPRIRAELKLTDGDLTNNSSSADMTLP